VKLLIDMNLSPEWVPYLRGRGIDAVHWSSIGAGNASDSEIMQWARDNTCIVFTNDLDFGILLAHSKDSSPSSIQARTQDVSPDRLGPIIIAALQAHREALDSGALLTIDPSKSRIRILPI
jgi:predicted nuclease of predicted toxin-antitoxin system